MRVERLIMRIKRKAEEDAGLEKAIKRADHSHCRKLNSSYDSRIVRVSRSSGGKDRHSKVLTAKGLRDRRVRLSVSTAIQFYDLQERLGVDQPSKALEWLIKAAADAIDQLPALNMPAAFQATQQTSIPLQSIRNSTPDCPLETLKVNEKSVSEALGGSFFDASQELRKLPEANTKAVLKRRSTSIADGGKRVNDSCPPALSHCRLRSRAMAGHIQTKRKALKECRKERGNLSFTDLSQNVVSMGAQDYTVKLISGTSDHSLASDHPEKTLSTTSSHVGLTNAGNQIRYQCLEQHKDKKKPVHLPDSISSQNYSNPPVAGSAAIPGPIIGNPLPITGNTDMHRNSSELQAQLLPYDRMPSFSAARSLICGRETLQSNSSHNFMNYYMQSHRQALSQRLNEVLSCAPFQGYDAQRSIHEFGVHESSNITTLPLPKQFRYPHQHPYS